MTRDYKLAGARKVVAMYAERERKHLAICGECHSAGLDVYKRCADGWQIAKELTRAKYAAADIEETRAAQPGTEPLF